jgi:hypothetical protein
MPGESEVLLMNEARAWARIGMSFHGVPTCIAGQVNGIQVNIFDERIRLATMQEFLIEAGICTLDELDEKFRANKLEAMQEMRANNEDAVKAAFIKQKIATPDKRLLGPHGEIL